MKGILTDQQLICFSAVIMTESYTWISTRYLNGKLISIVFVRLALSQSGKIGAISWRPKKPHVMLHINALSFMLEIVNKANQKSNVLTNACIHNFAETNFSSSLNCRVDIFQKQKTKTKEFSSNLNLIPFLFFCRI